LLLLLEHSPLEADDDVVGALLAGHAVGAESQPRGLDACLPALGDPIVDLERRQRVEPLAGPALGARPEADLPVLRIDRVRITREKRRARDDRRREQREQDRRERTRRRTSPTSHGLSPALRTPGCARPGPAKAARRDTGGRASRTTGLFAFRSWSA